MLKLGKLPARPNSVKLKFGSFFDVRKLSKPPPSFGHYGQGAGLPWGVFSNDKYGDCVFAGAAHETMVWTHRSGSGKPAMFDDAGVLGDYSAVTGFTASDPNSDQGTDMQAAASYRLKSGIVDAAGKRHKIDAYVELPPGDPETLALAGFITGACGVGVRFPSTAWSQFDSAVPWVVNGRPYIDGGHYVPFVGRNSNGFNLCVTWGRLHAFDDDWLEKYCDEAVAYVSFEFLDHRGLTPEGFDRQGLLDAVKAVSKTK